MEIMYGSPDHSFSDSTINFRLVLLVVLYTRRLLVNVLKSKHNKLKKRVYKSNKSETIKLHFISLEIKLEPIQANR